MKIIIIKTTKGIGERGELLEVKDGYAFNHLIPKKIAVPATESNRKALEERLKQAEDKATLVKKKAQELAKKIKQQKFVLQAKSSGEKIFGTLTHLQIAQAINEKLGGNAQIQHTQVSLKAPIHSIGRHPVILSLHEDVQTEIEIEVKASSTQ